ncbi:MAG: CRTAC1 family protein [Verrucomicrobia bacterium]|nr:CRTAC1 family protein [Verrucomicrobiota bacterium]
MLASILGFHRTGWRGVAALGLLGLVSWLGMAEDASPRVLNAMSANPATEAALEMRRARQVEASRSWKIFHDFSFTDRQAQSGIDFRQRPVDDGAKTYKAVHYDHGNGLAAADVDGDGRIDLYFVNQWGSSQLWRNTGGGRFENITDRAGVGLADRIGVSASFADIDNDGRADLFVTTVRMGNKLFRNLGGGRFEDVTEQAGLGSARPAHSSGAVFFDYNRDGLLDLFVCNVGVYTRNERGRGGFFLGRSDAFQGWMFPARSEASVLYVNRGGGRFEDVSKAAGLEHRGWSGDAGFCDLNRDGFPDLYVLSMSGSDQYYENQAGRGFREKTKAHFPKTPWGSMGMKFFDYDLDGLMELLVTDMHSDMTSVQIQAGERDFSEAFEKRTSEVWCAAEWSPANFRSASNNIFGNAFYRQRGPGVFEESSQALGLETYWPWAVTVADWNADGFEDVLVTAGMGYPLRYAPNSLLLNDEGRRFLDSEFVVGLEPRSGRKIEVDFFTLDCSGEDRKHPLCKDTAGRVVVRGSASSRASVAFDLDDDGDLDAVLSEWNDVPQVLVSNLSERRPPRYLKVSLEGTRSNRDGLGATLRVVAGNRVYTRMHDGKSGYLSQSAMPLYFGLGDGPAVDRVEIDWPSGVRQVVSDGLPRNGLLRVRESESNR